MTDIRRLPAPVAQVWEWQLRGACRGLNTDMFFHPESERGHARADREARAKEVCQGCPVLEQCRSHSLLVQEPYGIWGGLSVPERELIIQNSQAGSAGLRAPGTPSPPERARRA